jgi:hypothetical protein
MSLEELKAKLPDEPEIAPIVEEPSIVESSTELTEEEQKAMEQGWRPKDQYSGPEEDWVDAHTYLGRGTFLKQIKSLKSEVEEQKRTMELYGEHYKRMEKLIYDKAKREIEESMRAARATGNFDAYEEAQKNLQELKPISEQPQNPADNPAVKKFIAENAWYTNPITDEDFELKAIAMAHDAKYSRDNPNATIEEVVAYVEKKIQEKKRGYMTNSNRESAPPATLTGSAKAAAPKTNPNLPHPEWNKLSDFQKEVVKKMTDSKFGVKGYKENPAEGVKKYIEELKKLGAI